MGVMIFNGKSSIDFQIQVEHPPGETFPERDYEAQHVFGRNGDILVTSKEESFKNRERTYDIALGSYEKSFEELMRGLSEWLFTSPGYSILEDSYSPDVYRLAFYAGSTDMENLLDHMGRGQLVFNCRPEKFLKSGKDPISIKNGGVLRNPTDRIAKPIIKIAGTGVGKLVVGDSIIDITNIGNFLTINSEIEDVYDDSITNRNKDVKMATRKYPRFYPGSNTVTFSGGITSVEVIPRWWTI